jgi:hypothetical protein
MPVLSGFFGNKLEYYRKMLLLVILKTLIPSNLRDLVYVTEYQTTLDTYINICPRIAGYILESTSSSSSPFATNISYPFRISFKPPFATQFSRHSLSNVFDQSFYISAVFPPLICFVCRVT